MAEPADGLWNDGDALDARRSAELLEQYKLFVASAEQVSTRRGAASSYFLSVNSAILAFVGYLTSQGSTGDLWPLAVAGLALTVLWRAIIASYKALNTAKFSVIHRIEARLPARPFVAEWDLIRQAAGPVRYLPLSQVEAGVPWVFFILHGIVLIRSLGAP